MRRGNVVGGGVGRPVNALTALIVKKRAPSTAMRFPFRAMAILCRA